MRPAQRHTRTALLGLALFATALLSHAQQGVTTLGVQLKPVIPVSYFDPTITLERQHLNGRISLDGGFSFGMNVRIGLSKMLSLETGLGQIQRRYSFSLANDTSGYAESSEVRYVGYELPVALLVYLRLGEKSYMNVALGLSADFYPGDVQRDLEDGRIYIFRNRWAQLGALGNVGVEFRTEKSGILYVGATFHRPFTPMATADLSYYDRANGFFPYTMRGSLSGAYLTVDLRYYFHEDPERIRRKQK
ncbi:MAG: hypothetical protein JNM62_03465 [Flavobacteriales bacterium]|nr:hypothetical protein [Flavobacteriales bacterium]